MQCLDTVCTIGVHGDRWGCPIGEVVKAPTRPPAEGWQFNPTVDAVCKDMTVLSINRPCGLAPCLITVERAVSSSLSDWISLYWLAASVTGGDMSVTQTL